MAKYSKRLAEADSLATAPTQGVSGTFLSQLRPLTLTFLTGWVSFLTGWCLCLLGPEAEMRLPLDSA